MYIANLGAYNRGHLVGKWVKLPCDDLEGVIDDVLNGGDAIRSRDYADQEDEEVAIHDYECDIQGIRVNEYSNIVNLNEIAEKLESLSKYEERKLEAIIEAYRIDLELALGQIDDYHLNESIENLDDLGRYYATELSGIDLDSLGDLQYYIDFERYGEDIAADDGFLSGYGWLTEN